MGAFVQSASLLGTTANTRTQTFAAAVAGNQLILIAAVSQNAGANTINTPAGWTLLFGTSVVNDERVSIFGKVAVGGETSVTVTSSASQRFQTAIIEVSGYTLTVDSTSSASNAVGVLAGDTGTVTATGAGRLAILPVCVKNSETTFDTGTPAGRSRITVNNELGGFSTQKITLGVWYDLNVSTTARQQPTWGFSARYLGLGLLLRPTAGTLFTQSVSGAMSFSGATPKKATSRKVTGAVSFSGTRTAAPKARLTTGSFTPAGALSSASSLARTLTGALSWSGALSRTDNRTLTGALSFSGTRSSIKSVSQAVSGALTFSGALSRFPMKALAASLTPSGAIAVKQILVRTLTGILAPVGAVKKQTNRTIGGSAQFSGMVSGTLPTTRFFGVLRPTGTVTNGLPARTLYATLQTTGALAKLTARALVASLQASAIMNTAYIPTPPGAEPPSAGGGGEWVTFRDPFQAWPYVGARRRG